MSDYDQIIQKSLRCIHCGLCLDACPTFRLTANETQSPRGRIYLARKIAEGAVPLDRSNTAPFDACLGCRACETACPSGVEYAFILERIRERMEKDGIRPPAQSFARRQLLNMLTSPVKFAAALHANRLASSLAPHIDTMPAWAADALTGSDKQAVTMPATPKQVKIGALPVCSPAIGAKRYTVGILSGCVMRVLYGSINEATVRVLQRNGCDVIAPPDAGCCGALHVHTGYVTEAKDKARALLDAFEPYNLDALVINSAGCGSTLKEYGALLSDDPIYAQRAAAFSAKVKDICEFLAEIEMTPPSGRFDALVTYHDACHLSHGQKVTAQPRKVLASVPGLRMVPLPESDMCCGSAGTYNLTQPTTAQQLLDRKVDNIISTGADIVVMGNPGCLAWIAQGLAKRGATTRAMHPVEILDRAYAD